MRVWHIRSVGSVVHSTGISCTVKTLPLMGLELAGIFEKVELTQVHPTCGRRTYQNQGL